MKWAPEDIDSFVKLVAHDLVSQVNQRMNDAGLSRRKAADYMDVTRARVTQMLNNPGNMTIRSMVRLVRVLGLKVSIVIYEDEDISDGPIDPVVFLTCWERCGKPRDWFELGKI